MSSLTIYTGYTIAPESLQYYIDAAQAGTTLTLTGWGFEHGATVGKALSIVGGVILVPAGESGLTITANNVTIDCVTMQGPGASVYNGNNKGVYVSASAGSPVDSVKVRDCHITGFRYGGMYLSHVSNLTVSGNVIEDAVYAGIMAISVVTGTISNNTIQRIGIYDSEANSGNSYGIAVTNIESPISSDVLVSGNVVEDVPNWEAMDTHGGLRITFSGNTVRRSRRGVMLTITSADATDCVVDNNQFLSPISIPSDDQYAIVLILSENAHVTNNTITGWGTPDTDRAYLRSGDTNTTISGNTITP